MKKFITFLLAAAMMIMVSANNISVSNILLTGQNTASDYTMVQFDLSWENSWRTSSAPNNWDAAWVFVKYRVTVANGGDGLWHHASLNNVEHTAPSGSAIEIGLLTPETNFNATTNPGIGVFIYRSADGTGTFTTTGIQLRWNYGVNYSTGSTPIGDNDIIDIQVYSIEMVYVLSGNFYVGSGGTENSSFTTANSTSGATVPLQITSTTPTIQGNNAGSSASNLSARGNLDLTGTTTAAFATGYPSGYNAFYCMKYEISQQQYVDFLNSLSQTQATARKFNNSGYRYAITGTTIGSYATTNPFLACNMLAWTDIAAYLDWSGLRPMTELEFEKSCRGTESALANEYAWGTTGIVGLGYILNNSGAINEVVATNYSTTIGNALYTTTTIGSIGGPLRVGIFAGTTGNTGRVTSGATYYGIMEMSGNLWEICVTVGNSTGRAFTGTHGNGALATNGNADATTWPDINATGSSLRGGGINSSNVLLPVSDRSVGTGGGNANGSNFGGRGVRSAPSVLYDIGQSYGGGVIAYILQSGDPGYDANVQHGLIAAASDQSTGTEWGCWFTTITGADGTTLGTGNQNTIDIMSDCTTAGIAARLCGDLNEGGYEDWYLPSKDELNKLYAMKLLGFGGFASAVYWCSTEVNSQHAYNQNLATGTQGYTNKNYALSYVRAIRSF